MHIILWLFVLVAVQMAHHTTVCEACSYINIKFVGPFFQTYSSHSLIGPPTFKTSPDHETLIFATLLIYQNDSATTIATLTELNVTVDFATGGVTAGWPDGVTFTDPPAAPAADPTGGYQMEWLTPNLTPNRTTVVLTNNATGSVVTVPLLNDHSTHYSIGYRDFPVDELRTTWIGGYNVYFFVDNDDRAYVLYEAVISCAGSIRGGGGVRLEQLLQSQRCRACPTCVLQDGFAVMVDLANGGAILGTQYLGNSSVY
jgi:hypothetical protein